MLLCICGRACEVLVLYPPAPEGGGYFDSELGNLSADPMPLRLKIGIQILFRAVSPFRGQGVGTKLATSILNLET